MARRRKQTHYPFALSAYVSSLGGSSNSGNRKEKKRKMSQESEVDFVVPIKHCKLSNSPDTEAQDCGKAARAQEIAQQHQRAISVNEMITGFTPSEPTPTDAFEM